MLRINDFIIIPDAEIIFSFTASPGPGGQNVNKVATATLLRFNVLQSSSLPEDVRLRLINILGNRLTTHGELIIKASRHRTQERNKKDALDRLTVWIQSAVKPPKKRKKTKPTLASKEERLEKKKLQGAKKKLRNDFGGDY